MAKDDYHVIVYKILAYMYMQLKNGNKVNPEMISSQGELFSIPDSYWQYIMDNLFKEGYITGANIEPWGAGSRILLEDCMITPKGIEYICDNSLMEKVKSFLKDVKEITPFI